MNTSALIMMVVVQLAVTIVMVFCFIKVLRKPTKK